LMIDDVTTAIAAGHAPDFAHSRIVTACLETMAAAQD
jgi:hypothetical protein